MDAVEPAANETPLVKSGKRRPRKRTPDGAKVGTLTQVRALAGEVRARNAALRSRIEAQVEEWQGALVGDLGGAAALSTAERTLVSLAGSKLKLALALAAWIEDRPARVVRGDGAVADVATSFLRSSESVEKTLSTLGLKRRAVEAVSLREILSEAQDAVPVAPEADAQGDLAQVPATLDN